ncbi:MAG: IS3 family transposase, partial [[Clostridium] symbiosum]
MIPDRVRQKCVYHTIHQLHKEKGYSLSALCAVARIPRCSYYKWKNRKDSAAEQENASILEEMIRLYSEVKGIYGYR